VTKHAAVIDPSLEPLALVEYIQSHKLQVEKILITHAHFDHIYGLPYCQKMLPSINQVCLHSQDLDLWNSGAGARTFHQRVLSIDPPNCFIHDGQLVTVGEHSLQVLHTPGHTSGSVVFYSPELNAAFCGDLIFYHFVGRTDLPGGDSDQLIQSIQEKIFTLPSQTKLLSGHGPETTVSEEKANNPYVY